MVRIKSPILDDSQLVHGADRREGDPHQSRDCGTEYLFVSADTITAIQACWFFVADTCFPLLALPRDPKQVP